LTRISVLLNAHITFSAAHLDFTTAQIAINWTLIKAYVMVDQTGGSGQDARGSE